jgi:tRNA nucleotidyltransferase (CCA-adding enzyme)
VDALVPERVWKELERALGEAQPQRFFEVLRDCGALAKLMPELDALFGVPQPEQHHPEIDTGLHTLMVLQQAARLSDDIGVRLAALLHDLGKGTTPPEQWPKHIDHESRGVSLVKGLCKRLRVPNDLRDLAVHVCQYHLHCHRALELKPVTILKLFQSINVLRQPERLSSFLLACEADARGRTGFEERDYPQAGYLQACFTAMARVDSQALLAQGLTGIELGQALDRLRVAAIKDVKSTSAGMSE